MALRNGITVRVGLALDLAEIDPVEYVEPPQAAVSPFGMGDHDVADRQKRERVDPSSVILGFHEGAKQLDEVTLAALGKDLSKSRLCSRLSRPRRPLVDGYDLDADASADACKSGCHRHTPRFVHASQAASVTSAAHSPRCASPTRCVQRLVIAILSSAK
jgi:hypothetical protein